MSKVKTFAALKAEIAALEAQATEARRRELTEVLNDIKSKITTYGITAADLGFKASALASASKTKKVPATAGSPKYRDPKSGKTWTGYGRAPDWLASARNRDAFLVNPPAAAPSEAPAPSKPTKQVLKAKKLAVKPAQSVKLAMARNASKAAAAKKPAAKKAAAKKPALKKAVNKPATSVAPAPTSVPEAAAQEA